MKKLFSFLTVIILLLLCSLSFASVGIHLNGGQAIGAAGDIDLQCDPNSTITDDGFTYRTGCNANFVQAGISNGGSTSMTTAQTTISTSFSLIRKAIAASANPGFSTSSLPNGVPGQVLTIQITAVGSGGTWTVTPVKSTGWTSVLFNTFNVSAPQTVCLLYVNNTIGWIVLSYDGSTNPTFFDAGGV